MLEMRLCPLLASSDGGHRLILFTSMIVGRWAVGLDGRERTALEGGTERAGAAVQDALGLLQLLIVPAILIGVTLGAMQARSDAREDGARRG